MGLSDVPFRKAHPRFSQRGERDCGLDNLPEPSHALGCTAVAEDVLPPTDSQPYQALYRRYRPRRFADVRGQEPVSRALLNAVREDRVAHAYLFSGPRGTGKTSTARILAMALNCEAPVGGEPDGTCASCTAIRAGSSMDVFELDAASNRKLDEMRDLLSRVALGTPGRWKVYIIDEVHQLTSDAASALLKTLEEPPSHVVFVLATTDPQKVLPTIQSRTQHFEFRLLDGDLLTDLLSSINQDADLGLSPEAVELAVRRGRGSARDAESALEQLAAAGGGEDDGSPLVELVDALAERDVSRTLEAVASAIAAGRAPQVGERPGGAPAQCLLGGPSAISCAVAGRPHGQAGRNRKPDGPPVPRPVYGSRGTGHGRYARCGRSQGHTRGCAHPPRFSPCKHEPDGTARTRGAARKGHVGKRGARSCTCHVGALAHSLRGPTWRGGTTRSSHPA
jgi:DNA polymerase III subunit gamma/tau